MKSHKRKHSKSISKTLKSKSNKELKQKLIRNSKNKENKEKKSNKSNKKVIHDSSDEEDIDNSVPSDNKEEKEELAIEINDITEKLSNSTIYCREIERESILSFITAKKSESKTLFISGQPGTGKTSLVLDLFNSTSLGSKQYFIKLTINCMSLSSIQEFYNQIFKCLNNPSIYDYLTENYNKSYDKLTSLLKQTPGNQLLMNILSLLNSSTILIVLDEIDFFYQKNNELLFFDIINLPYLINTDMKMILISNNSDFDNEVFPKLLNRKIKTDKIVFKPYTPIELTNIMKKKLEEIKMIEYFSFDSIRFLSSKMNKTGDLRPIIEITKALILKYKDDFLSHKKKIELKDMFEVLKQKNIHLSEIISGMTTEQKMVVVAIFYALKKGEANLEEKEIYDKYKMIKTQSNSQQLSMEEFREVLKSFCENSLIEAKNLKGKSKSKGKGNNVFRVKYSDDDLDIIFTDSDMFRMFKKNNDDDSKNKEEEDEDKDD